MGVKDLYDGIAGYDIITGEHLSSQERTDKLLLGTGVMSFNLLLPVLSGLGVGKTIGQKLRTKADNLFRLEGVSPRILGETANELAEHTITSGIASELSEPNGYRSTADITAVTPSPAGEGIEETVEAVSREGVEVMESGSNPNIFKAPEITINNKGELTNGIYTLNQQDMLIHVDGHNPNKSQFLYDVDANKAKVPVTNGYVGVTGKGELTIYINVYRTKTGYIHGCPGNP